MEQNLTIENMNNEVQQLNTKEMEEVTLTSAEVKLRAVEEARQSLAKAKSVLESNKDAEANIKKSTQINISKAETTYLEALKKVELPTTKIEVWNEATNTAEQVIFTKEQKEIIIARDDLGAGITEDMLKQMMLPSLEENWKQNIKALVPSIGDTASTIGDVLKAKGINLS